MEKNQQESIFSGMEPHDEALEKLSCPFRAAAEVKLLDEFKGQGEERLDQEVM